MNKLQENRVTKMFTACLICTQILYNFIDITCHIRLSTNRSHLMVKNSLIAVAVRKSCSVHIDVSGFMHILLLFRFSLVHPYFQHMCVKLLLAAEPLPKIARLPPTRKHELAEVIILDIKPTNRLHICVSMLQSLQIIGNGLQCVLYGRRITLRTHFRQPI